MQFALFSIIVLISILNSISWDGIQFTRLVCFTFYIKSNEPPLTVEAFRFNTKILCNSCCVSRHHHRLRGNDNYIKFLFISNEKETTKTVHSTCTLYKSVCMCLLSRGICLSSPFPFNMRTGNLKINFNVTSLIFQIFEHSIYPRWVEVDFFH